MKTVRKNVFETNSSSTHSIAIPKSCNSANCIYFHIDRFGWGWNEVDPADYFYTAIYEVSNTEEAAEERLNKLKSILDSFGVEYRFGEARTEVYKYGDSYYLSLENGYIDHGYELAPFVDELLNDSDKLMRFLSGGLVFTGNDNCSEEESGFINRDKEYLFDYDWETRTEYKIDNPYYMSNHEDYDWYHKYN